MTGSLPIRRMVGAGPGGRGGLGEGRVVATAAAGGVLGTPVGPMALGRTDAELDAQAAAATVATAQTTSQIGGCRRVMTHRVTAAARCDKPPWSGCRQVHVQEVAELLG